MREHRDSDGILGQLFTLEGQVAVVTGATGVLGGEMARGLARAGARVGVLGRRSQRAAEVAREISDFGGEAIALPADVLAEKQLRSARDTVLDRWGRLDVLLNAAGGNVPGATLSGDTTIFDLPREAFGEVFDLNLLGTLVPIQVFGEAMAQSAQGCIINVCRLWPLLGRSPGWPATRRPRQPWRTLPAGWPWSLLSGTEPV